VIRKILRRPSLRSQLNQIRLWVRQGRTDPWIAHKLDISVEQLQSFKREQGVTGEAPPTVPPAEVGSELEDLEIETPPDDEPEQEEVESDASREDEEPEDDGDAEPEPAEPARRRRRGRRGGRRRSAPKGAESYEATFDHGDEGYGLWLDPAIAEDDVYSEHWSGQRAISVTIEPDAITIRRADDNSADGD
jgi:hypothetical protein